jgi:hypothetical protein
MNHRRRVRVKQAMAKLHMFRPEVMRLEDRLVPGEACGASMIWATGAADAGVVAQSQPTNAAAPGTNVFDSAAQSIYQLDTSTSAGSDDSEASSIRWDDSGTTHAPAPWEMPTPATSEDSSNVLADLSPDFGVGDNAPAQKASPTGPVSPGTASTGATAAPDQAAPGGGNMSAPSSPAPVNAGSGGVNPGTAGSGLAALLSAAGQLATAGQGQQSSGDTGGFATPLFAAAMASKPNVTAATAPYTPAQIRHAYGIDQLSNQGNGQTIYIVDAYNDPNIVSNVATFNSTFGLQQFNVTGGPTLTVHKMSSRIGGNSGWGLEESLDVEWAHAIAPQANIVLVEATNNSNTNLYGAVNWATSNGAHIVSMSWGGGDGSGETSYDSYFNHSGVTYIASAGDTGGQVIYPSASPYVLSVGGTSLSIDTSGNYISESAWSSGGGGASVGEKEPGYQTSYGISLSGRGTPDVAFDADPNTGVYVYDTYGAGGWYEVGGTSLGAPAWAGIIALADQSRVTPLSTNNLTSRTEYNAASGSLYASNYHDVTTGSNGYPAGIGYDLATGLGSPLVNNLVRWLISSNT